MKTILLLLNSLLLFVWQVNAQAADSPLTVSQVMQKIREQVQPQWTDSRTDTIVIGNADDTVTGIATCMFADMNILKRAVAAHCNLIITHEPVFYTGTDQVQDFMKNDRVLIEKRDYIMEHRLTIFRFHDNAHRNNPDMIMQGLADLLGGKLLVKRPWILELKKQSLASLAASLKKLFAVPGIRVVGDANWQVSRVGLMPGMAPTLPMHLGPLQRDDVDVILVGEAREWEDYVYATDARLQGKPKAAIFIGHLASEEPGMKYCANWLGTFIKGTKIQFLKNEPYWWVPK